MAAWPLGQNANRAGADWCSLEDELGILAGINESRNLYGVCKPCRALDVLRFVQEQNEKHTSCSRFRTRLYSHSRYKYFRVHRLSFCRLRIYCHRNSSAPSGPQSHSPDALSLLLSPRELSSICQSSTWSSTLSAMNSALTRLVRRWPG